MDVIDSSVKDFPVRIHFEYNIEKDEIFLEIFDLMEGSLAQSVKLPAKSVLRFTDSINTLRQMN